MRIVPNCPGLIYVSKELSRTLQAPAVEDQAKQMHAICDLKGTHG